MSYQFGIDSNGGVHAAGGVVGLPFGLSIPFGDGTSVLTTSSLLQGIVVPFAFTITSVSLYSNVSCTASCDIFKNGTSITASDKPSLSAATSETDSTLTGWTKTFAVNDVLKATIVSNDNSQQLTLSINGTRN